MPFPRMRAAVEGGDDGSVSEGNSCDALRDWHLRRKIETLETEGVAPPRAGRASTAGPVSMSTQVFDHLRARFGQPQEP